VAPAAFARWAFVRKVQRPRCASAIVPRSEPAGRAGVTAFGAALGPQRYGSTALPSPPRIDVTSTTVWSRVLQPAGSFAPPAPWIGTAPRFGGPPITVSEGEKTWRFETAATAIASGTVPGEPVVPRPKSSRSLPAAITGTTPAAATLRTVSYIASFAGSVCAPPPEKLMTSIPSTTACSNAATICGVFAMWPSGVGTLNTR
jgi:hypothetical protein